jgi:hypothetical protein
MKHDRGRERIRWVSERNPTPMLIVGAIERE